MHTVPTALPGVVLIQPDVHRDPRGFFLETYHADRYRAFGIDSTFVQDNHSRSVLGTVRGLHLQVERPQGKLIRVVLGEIFDVAVDVRLGSPTFACWIGNRLSAENFTQVYVPEGFAHGFSVLSPVAEVEYKCTDFYDPASELGLAWNEPAFAIEWHVERPIVSLRDQGHLPLAAVRHRLPAYTPTEV